MIKLFILFLYIFSFKVPFFYNSTIISLFLLFFIVIFKFIIYKKFSLVYYQKLLKNNYFINILLLLFFIIIVSMIFPIIDSTYDFTILKPLINQFISLIGALFLIITLNISNQNEIQKLIIYTFFFQALIEISAFLNPSILSIVQIFQNESMIEIGKQYAGGGLRALALSGSQFFGLSSAFAFIYVLMFHYYIQKKNFTYFDTILIIITIVGTFFAGRTGFIGLFFAFIYFLIKKKDFKRKSYIFFKIIVILFILYFILINFILSNEMKEFVFKQLVPYSFEFILNLINNGHLSTHSSDQLNQQYFFVDNLTYLFGRGLNEIYLSDAGYMRNILYGGIGWFLLLSIYQILIIFYSIKLDKANKLLYIILLILLFVLHIKGESVGFLVITQKILFLLLMTNIYFKIKNKKFIGDYNEK